MWSTGLLAVNLSEVEWVSGLRDFNRLMDQSGFGESWVKIFPASSCQCPVQVLSKEMKDTSVVTKFFQSRLFSGSFKTIFIYFYSKLTFLIRKNHLALCTCINILVLQKDFYYLPEMHVNPILFHGSACLFTTYWTPLIFTFVNLSRLLLLNGKWNDKDNCPSLKNL